MSDINKAVLKVAQQNPEFRKALTAELSKEAATVGRTPVDRRQRARVNSELQTVIKNLEMVRKLVLRPESPKDGDHRDFDDLTEALSLMGQAGASSRKAAELLGALLRNA